MKHTRKGQLWAWRHQQAAAARVRPARHIAWIFGIDVSQFQFHGLLQPEVSDVGRWISRTSCCLHIQQEHVDKKSQKLAVFTRGICLYVFLRTSSSAPPCLELPGDRGESSSCEKIEQLAQYV